VALWPLPASHNRHLPTRCSELPSSPLLHNQTAHTQRHVRTCTVLVLASVMATLAWLWAHLTIRGGSPNFITIFVFVVYVFVWFFSTQRRPTNALGVILTLTQLAVSGCANSCNALADYNPGGGISFEMANNLPQVHDQGFSVFMLGGGVIGLSALVPLFYFLHFAQAPIPSRESQARVLGSLGLWLALVVVVLVGLGRATELALARYFLPHVILAMALLVTSLWLSSHRRWYQTVTVILAGGFSLFVAWFGVVTPWHLPSRLDRDNARLCAEGHGLVRSAGYVGVREYQAPGLSLRRIDCRMTGQYNDEKRFVVVGSDADGNEHLGPELFARTNGNAEQRARAACDTLLAGFCEQVLLGSENSYYLGATRVDQISPPREEGGGIVFFATRPDYLYGMNTTLGKSHVVTRYDVDLRTSRIKATNL
jgi:hypothetical protein